MLNARLRAAKTSGGAVEIWSNACFRRRSRTQLRASHAPKPGTRLTIVGRAGSPVPGSDGPRRPVLVVQLLDGNANFETLMREAGELPLPPYMQRARVRATPSVIRRSTRRTKVPSPRRRRGLHFDESLWPPVARRDIAMTHVTLHVGATFLPVKSENIAEHRMHRERYVLSQQTVDAINACRARNGRVVAGTTSVRTLEGGARLRGAACA